VVPPASGRSCGWAAKCCAAIRIRRRLLKRFAPSTSRIASANWRLWPRSYDAPIFPALKTAAHNLKGTGAAYGFAELTELGRALESAAKEGDGLRAEILLGRTAFYLGLVHSRQP
jgi:chemotaxis protein histidine kinase CheA